MSHDGDIDTWKITTSSPTKPTITVEAASVQQAYERAVWLLQDPTVDLLALHPDPDLPEDAA